MILDGDDIQNVLPGVEVNYIPTTAGVLAISHML